MSAPTVIPVVDGGGSCSVWPVGTYFLETHGTPLHGKRVAPELVVWAVGALAEGLGIRAVARVFAVDPEHGAAVVGGGGGPRRSLFPPFPPRRPCHAGATG